MTEQYIAEIRVFGFNFAPLTWAQCNGQQMSISQNTTLFSIIGTTYGGDGVTTFNLPNLQDRTAVGMGQGQGLMNWPLGAVAGEASHTLLTSQVPSHSHTVTGGAGVEFAIELRKPDSTSYLGRWDGRSYIPGAPNSTLGGATIGPAGGSQPHPNIQPVLAINYCIALSGIYPSQS
jgi:microcystin-dependent protein